MVHHFEGRIESSSYTVDGKERVASLGTDGSIRAQATWDGASLVIEKQLEIARGISTSTSRYSLSKDGQQLVITNQVHRSNLGGAFDELLIYDRQ